jgi:L-lactate dehydrogenase complex protein LldG
VDTCERSLESVNTTCKRTAAAEFAEVLTGLLEEPSVGAPLPFEGVSYDGTPVVADPTMSDLKAAKTGVTPVSFGIADYGSVIIESTENAEEPMSLFPERHVAVLARSDVVDDMSAAFERLGDRIRGDGHDRVIATGPSATADMGDLVLGAHGPREVTLVILEDR